MGSQSDLDFPELPEESEFGLELEAREVPEPGIDSFLVHTQGYTVVSYNEDGNFLLTAGADGAIRFFLVLANGNIDDRPINIIHHTKGIRCIGINVNGKLVTASEDKTVALFSLTTKKFESLLYRCTLPARHVSFNTDGLRVAVASDDSTIQIVNTVNISDVVVVKGHTNSVRCVEFDPDGEFLVSSSCDGTIRVWDMRYGEPRFIKHFLGIIPHTDPGDPQTCQIAWHPSGKCFAVPGDDKDVVIVNKNTWKYNIMFKDQHKQVYDLSTQYMRPSMVTEWTIFGHSGFGLLHNDLEFNKEEVFMEVDVQGTLYFWEPFDFDDIENEGSVTMEEDDVVLDRIFNISIDDAECEDADKNAPRRSNRLKYDYKDDYFDLDDFVEDDDGAGYVPKKPAYAMDRKSNVDISTPQKPFQPGSTPEKEKSRYLVFNLIGCITTLDQGTHSTVSVEYLDKSVCRPYHFTDLYNFSMGCLGRQGAAFAAESSTGGPSVISFQPETRNSRGEWTLELPSGECVTALALSGKGPIAATSKNYIRFFSSGGVQTKVFSLPSIVCMTANDEFAMFIYHVGPGLKGSQNLGYILYNIESHDFIQDGHLPLSTGAVLNWLDFSQDGLPAIYDSKGVLSILHRHREPRQARWIPILDTSTIPKEEGKTVTYWPVGILDMELMCVKCKDGQEHPSLPRPPIDEVSFQMPLLQIDKPIGQFEEKYMRMNTLIDYEQQEAEARNEYRRRQLEFRKKYTEIDKILLQLIQMACKAEKIERAYDLATLLNSPATIEAAIKIAQHNNYAKLAERINALNKAYRTEESRQPPLKITSRQRIPLQPPLQQPEVQVTTNTSSLTVQDSPQMSPQHEKSTEDGDVDVMMGDEATTTRHNDAPNQTVKRHAEEMDVNEENNHIEEAPIFKKANLTHKADPSHRKNPFLRKPSGQTKAPGLLKTLGDKL
ncbi:6831_t:CDS:10 [Paraglomus occultum]|uniref:6831_t:CDS:1 n=1 Tax=Paraglomus occultum TaxID=144539 RepID=A0A9N8W9D3_9GLOM|nr:6831_t:CDS:10 [Paraglomus occultum]